MKYVRAKCLIELKYYMSKTRYIVDLSKMMLKYIYMFKQNQIIVH